LILKQKLEIVGNLELGYVKMIAHF
jgi:hypothetical protein